ncbi:MAG: hypothetical protein QJR14_08495 [Bacillota bacterium]|nr:hypothetical protein [Bacillota bacterium]
MRLGWCTLLVRRFRREALALAAVILMEHLGWLPRLPADPFASAAQAAPSAPSPLWLTALTLAVALLGFFVPREEQPGPLAALRGRAAGGTAGAPAEDGSAPAGPGSDRGISPVPPTRPAR